MMSLLLGNDMMNCRSVLLAALCILINGCIVIHPEGGDVVMGTKEFTGETGVLAQEISDVSLVLSRKGETSATLSIACTGRFDVETSWERKDRPGTCKSIAIGLFPGYLAEVDRNDGGHYLAATLLPVVSPFANACFLFIPTFITLFCEPFKDGYRNSIHQTAPFGFVGCYKYWGRKTWFESYDHEWIEVSSAAKYEIGGFTVQINGVRYECPEGQREVVVTVPSGAHAATVRIVSAPKFKGELGRYVDSLVGQEFVLPIEQSE